MGTYTAVDLPNDCWGIDTVIAGALTDTQLIRLLATPLPPLKPGQPPRPLNFLWGYVPLPGNRSAWDMTGPRMRAACDIGWIVLLVQHCRSGLWFASEVQGQVDGQWAAEYADLQGYPKDAHLALDDEAVANAGAEVAASATGWCNKLRAAALPCLYEGFSPGLSPEQEYELPDVDRYWGAHGPWDVDRRGVCCRQGLQTVHCGVSVDPDHAFADKLGGVLRGMAKAA